MAFNEMASPKIETKRFKIYADVSESGLAPSNSIFFLFPFWMTVSIGIKAPLLFNCKAR